MDSNIRDLFNQQIGKEFYSLEKIRYRRQRLPVLFLLDEFLTKRK